MDARTKFIEDENAFKPFTLEIDVNDEDTAKALYNIFNHLDIRIASGIHDFSKVRKALAQTVPSFKNHDGELGLYTGFYDFSKKLKQMVG